MKRVGILHITDLHCSQESGESVGEVKDPERSPWYVDEVTYEDSFALFQRRIGDVLGKRQVDVLAFSGDLGWGRDPATLELGIQKLAALGDRLNLERKSILIAPGNHDLIRSADPGQEFH